MPTPLPWPSDEWRGPHVGALALEDQARLATLLVAAWETDDCALAFEQLAALGRALQQALGRWFARVGDRYVCTLLKPAHDKARKKSAIRRAAALVRWRGVQMHEERPMQMHVRTPMHLHSGQQMHLHEEGSMHLHQDGGVFDTNPYLNAGSAEDASEERPMHLHRDNGMHLHSDDGPSDAGDGGPSACGESADLDGFPDTPASGSFPPKPPLCEKELEELSSSEGRGVGKGGNSRTPDTDLFGQQLRRGPIGEEEHKLILGLLHFYIATVQPSRSKADRKAVYNVRRLLRAGIALEALEKAVLAYGREMDNELRDPDFRKGARGFFERSFVLRYIGKPTAVKAPEIAQDATARKPGASPYEGFALRLRAKIGELAPAFDWFPLWAEKLAKTFSFDKAKDLDELSSWVTGFAAEKVTEAEADRAIVTAMRMPFFTGKLSRAQFRTAFLSVIHRDRTTKGRQPGDDVPPAGQGTFAADWNDSPLRQRLREQQAKLAEKAKSLRDQPRGAPHREGPHASDDRGTPM